ncbi:MAG: Deoxyguanosine kinase [Flavobacteriia bacterium]|nr:MAG: Deoxyguanosine kinase [Flavobacteriia bacterium]
MLIAIEGIIGAGKTTLAKRLAAEWDAHLLLERFEDNPYLASFYADPKRFALPLELSFAAQRGQQWAKACQSLGRKKHLISDFHFEKSLVFASVTLEKNAISPFSQFSKSLFEDLQRPDLIILLQPEPERALENIVQRARGMEVDIPLSYLQDLSTAYVHWINENAESKVLELSYSSNYVPWEEYGISAPEELRIHRS